MTKKSKEKLKYLEKKEIFLSCISHHFSRAFKRYLSFRPETALLTILAIKKRLFKVKDLKDCHFMEHSSTGLRFSITVDF